MRAAREDPSTGEVIGREETLRPDPIRHERALDLLEHDRAGARRRPWARRLVGREMACERLLEFVRRDLAARISSHRDTSIDARSRRLSATAPRAPEALRELGLAGGRARSPAVTRRGPPRAAA